MRYFAVIFHNDTGYQIHDCHDLLHFLSIILWNGKHYYRPVCLTNAHISYHVCGPPNSPGYGVIGEETSSMAPNYYSRWL
jgi:hypothetical protein